MDTIGKIGAIRPCSLEQLVEGQRIDNAAIKSSSWEWMFRVLKAAAEHATEGIVVLDAAGVIRFANEISAKAHGYASRTNLLGKDLAAFHSPEQMAGHVTPFMKEAMREGQWEGPLEHIRADGALFSTRTKMTRVRNEDWDNVGLIIFHTYAGQLDEARPEPAPAENRVPAAFCEKLTQPVINRYSGSETDSGHDTSDPYLELRKASGGPLNTGKLAELAEMLKRLG
jgi:PAS domain S-box-containing protein